ncbi:endogenous retrovirus group K member 113 Gag polyprotein [Mustela lutreola]|uniref:endogenous retrovirus group K member 113 Gag polyprotein n=1 Tax=Mustela lutreola TaxID=9666 RepID=UPI00279758F2|nr:endogenous retrovirus group K member 113 Gag polyprotein [Mustela lutreola]
MGNKISRCKMENPLKDVLKANGTPLKTKTAHTFLREVAKIAPWFIDEGLLNMPQWEHLGEDLICCPSVTPGTLAVWSLVKVYLQSTREPLKQAVQQGGEVLEQVREESRKGSSKDSDPGSESSEGLSDNELQEKGEKEDLEIIRQQFESKETGLQKMLEELKMQREVMTQLKAKVQAEAATQPELKAGVTDKAQLELEANVTPPPLSNPSAPPCEWPPPYRPSCAKTCHCSECKAQSWREVLGPGKGFFPVLEDQNQQRYHQPLDFKLVKQLKEAISAYGPQAAFTVSLVESLGALFLIPEDWANLTRAVLSGGQYLEWKIQNQDNCQDTARRNAAAGNPQWDLDMLTGAGPYLGAQAQSVYPPAVYQQTSLSSSISVCPRVLSLCFNKPPFCTKDVLRILSLVVSSEPHPTEPDLGSRTSSFLASQPGDS